MATKKTRASVPVSITDTGGVRHAERGGSAGRDDARGAAVRLSSLRRSAVAALALLLPLLALALLAVGAIGDACREVDEGGGARLRGGPTRREEARPRVSPEPKRTRRGGGTR